MTSSPANARTFAAALLGLDAVMLLAVFNVLAGIRGLVSPGSILVVPYLLPLGALIVGLYLIDGYRLRTDMLSLAYTSQHLIALAGVVLAMLFVIFALVTEFALLRHSRAVIALGFAVLAPLTLGYRRLLYLRFTRGRRERSFLFVGRASEFASFAADFAASGLGQRLTAVPTDGLDAATLRDRLFAAIDRDRARLDGVILRESNLELPGDAAERLVALHFAGVPIYTLEIFHEAFWRRIPLYRLNQVWLLQEGFDVAREPTFERIKRLCDILAATAGLVFAAPFWLLVPPLIWLCDGRPVLFRQTRVGLNRRPFTLVKFRTMRAVAEGSNAAADGTARITALGRWLRQARLDELPQLWNVLKGDMSLIGPRAEWAKLVADYEKTIPCYHFRHLVRPGITGWAQVNQPHGTGREDTMRKLEYDLYYLRHFSFRLDASIVLKTIHTMLFGQGR